MDARGERRTLVHCFANFRASAFTYLYRTLRLGVPEAEARADLETIWTEEGLGGIPAVGRIHRAGAGPLRRALSATSASQSRRTRS